MAADVESLIATGIASALGTIAAAAIGLRYALARFRKERSFDRRLGWHEQTVKELTDTANKLIIALNTMRRPGLEARRHNAWAAVSEGFARLLPLETEAELYASNEAYQAIVRIAEDVRALSTAAEHVAQMKAKSERAPGADPLAVYDIVVRLLLHGASRLATDVRRELELDELNREVRLYDDAFADHLDDLAAKGIKEPSRAQVPRAGAAGAQPELSAQDV